MEKEELIEEIRNKIKYFESQMEKFDNIEARVGFRISISNLYIALSNLIK